MDHIERIAEILQEKVTELPILDYSTDKNYLLIRFKLEVEKDVWCKMEIRSKFKLNQTLKSDY